MRKRGPKWRPRNKALAAGKPQPPQGPAIPVAALVNTPGFERNFEIYKNERSRNRQETAGLVRTLGRLAAESSQQIRTGKYEPVIATCPAHLVAGPRYSVAKIRDFLIRTGSLHSHIRQGVRLSPEDRALAKVSPDEIERARARDYARIRHGLRAKLPPVNSAHLDQLNLVGRSNRKAVEAERLQAQIDQALKESAPQREQALKERAELREIAKKFATSLVQYLERRGSGT